MGEVQRYREGGLMYESEHGDYVRRADCVRLERELDELRRAFERAEADVQALSREVERLRKVEADAQVIRNQLEAVERAVTAVSEAMMMRANRWKETQSAQWAGDSLALFAVSLAEACGRKG